MPLFNPTGVFAKSGSISLGGSSFLSGTIVQLYLSETFSDSTNIIWPTGTNVAWGSNTSAFTVSATGMLTSTAGLNVTGVLSATYLGIQTRATFYGTNAVVALSQSSSLDSTQFTSSLNSGGTYVPTSKPAIIRIGAAAGQSSMWTTSTINVHGLTSWTTCSLSWSSAANTSGAGGTGGEQCSGPGWSLQSGTLPTDAIWFITDNDSVYARILQAGAITTQSLTAGTAGTVRTYEIKLISGSTAATHKALFYQGGSLVMAYTGAFAASSSLYFTWGMNANKTAAASSSMSDLLCTIAQT